MTMSQQNQFTNQETTDNKGPLPLPCFAKCINLQTMHPIALKRLGLQYHTMYTLIDDAQNPTPDHLGRWVKVSGIGDVLADGTREWIPATLFFTYEAIWPN